LKKKLGLQNENQLAANYGLGVCHYCRCAGRIMCAMVGKGFGMIHFQGDDFETWEDAARYYYGIVMQTHFGISGEKMQTKKDDLEPFQVRLGDLKYYQAKNSPMVILRRPDDDLIYMRVTVRNPMYWMIPFTQNEMEEIAGQEGKDWMAMQTIEGDKEDLN